MINEITRTKAFNVTTNNIANKTVSDKDILNKVLSVFISEWLYF